MKAVPLLLAMLLVSQALLGQGYFAGIEESAISRSGRDYSLIRILLVVLSVVFFAVATWAWATRKTKKHPLSGVLGAYVITGLYIGAVIALTFVFTA